RWGTLADEAAFALWDIDALGTMAPRSVQRARDAGALGLLALALQGAAIAATWTGEFRAAASMVAEAEAVTSAAGVRISSFGGMLLAVFRGHKAEASRLLETTVKRATARGEGLGVQYAQWASAVLWNSLGRYEEALVSARAASSEDAQL